MALCGFLADDMTGFGAGQADIKPNATAELRVTVDSTHGDRLTPPKRLLPLIDEIRRFGPPEYLRQVITANAIPYQPPGGGFKLWVYYRRISENLQHRVNLPTGRKATFADVMTAFFYLKV